MKLSPQIEDYRSLIQQIETTLEELKQEQERRTRKETIQQVQGLDRMVLTSWSNDRRITRFFCSSRMTVWSGWISIVLLIVLMPASWWLALHTPAAQFWTTCIYWHLAVAVCLISIAMALLQYDPQRRQQVEQQLTTEQQHDETRTLELAQAALEAQNKRRDLETQLEQIEEDLNSEEIREAVRNHLVRTPKPPTKQEFRLILKRYREKKEKQVEQSE